MNTTQKWLVGCGIGCGVILLLIGALIGGGIWLGTKLEGELEQVELTRSQLTQRHGSIRDYVPPADGSIDPGRIEAFLRVREDTEGLRVELEAGLDQIARAETRGGPGGVMKTFKLIRSGVGLVPAIVGYLTARDEALLAASMGPGEYLYIYAMAFVGEGRYEPSAGPPFLLVGDDDEDDDRFTFSGGRTYRRREELVRDVLNESLTPMLEGQLVRLEATAREGEWGRALATEVEELRRDQGRIAWEDGLPEPIARSLEPYRERLDASWSELCNPIELQMEF